MTKISREFKHFVMLPLCALFFFIGVITVQATTYYVAPTGSNSNNGTAVGTPFLTIQQCIDTMAAGDTCTVANGIYTAAGTTPHVGRMDGNAGTAGNPITLKSTNPRGAKILLPNNVGAGNYGFYIQRAYWIIDGFEIYGNVPSNANLNQVGIPIFAQGVIVRNNTIHNIATNACSNSVNGNAALYLDVNATNVTIDSNIIYTIGRRWNGESGCSTTISSNDHGIYIDAVNTLSITRNLFYDAYRGWAVHVYTGTGGTTSNLTIYNNTFADGAPGGAVNPAEGQIVLATRVTNVSIKNNLSYNARVGMVRCSGSVIPTNVVVEYNLSSNLIKNSECTSNITFTSTNLQNTSPGLVNVGARDYHLATSSAAIDVGVPTGLAYTGVAPDMGAYEFGQAGDAVAPLSPIGLRVQ